MSFGTCPCTHRNAVFDTCIHKCSEICEWQKQALSGGNFDFLFHSFKIREEIQLIEA